MLKIYYKIIILILLNISSFRLNFYSLNPVLKLWPICLHKNDYYKMALFFKCAFFRHLSAQLLIAWSANQTEIWICYIQLMLYLLLIQKLTVSTLLYLLSISLVKSHFWEDCYQFKIVLFDINYSVLGPRIEFGRC